jgi:hypothetical protein
MANQFYNLGLEAYQEAAINGVTDTIAAVLCSASYVPNYGTDQFYSTVVASGGVIAGPVSFTGKSGSAGSLSVADLTFSSVSKALAAGTQVVIFKNTGTPASSRLIGNINVANNLPVTPDNGDITLKAAFGVLYTI